MTTEEIHTILPHRLVHFDLKGAPLSIGYISKILPLLHHWGATDILLEYEDTFPYSGGLSVLKAPHAYSVEDIKKIQSLAAENNISIIPLVQTFGHLEFVLKHDKFCSLREVEKYPMALCPSHPDSVPLVCSMVDQVMSLHTGVEYFHIGCDEVFHLGICQACQAKASAGKDKLFFSHVKSVATHVKRAGLTCLIWDDMFRFTELGDVLSCGLGNLVEPMVWHYVPNFALPTDLWDKLSAVFPRVWVASAWKGATGPRAQVTSLRYHLDNTQAWVNVTKVIRDKFKVLQGIALTGWQRFDHYAVLCELFPQGLPCLALCLRLVMQGTISHSDVEVIQQELTFTSPLPIDPLQCPEIPLCEFPGSPVYQLTLQFAHLEAAVKEFFGHEGLSTWANDYNIRRGFINPVHMEPLLERAKSLLAAMVSLRSQVSVTFTPVFVPGVDSEWRAVYVEPLVARLDGWIKQADRSLPLKHIREKVDDATDQPTNERTDFTMDNT